MIHRLIVPSDARPRVALTVPSTEVIKVMAQNEQLRKQVVKKVVKTPRTGTEIAGLLGLPSYRSVSRILGDASKAGEIVSTPKGYVKAAA